MALRCLLASLLVAVACQPMHGGPPETLRDPAEKPKPSAATPAQSITYVEDCTVDFADDAVRWHPRPVYAQQLVAEGDIAQQSAAKASVPAAKRDGTLDALKKYQGALLENPYDAEATLKLALEYDALLRKGCALAMLRRLTALTINPKFVRDANARIQTVEDNPGWFKAYRNEALVAVGLPPSRARATP
jgi:hypothetical protein